MVSKKVTKKRPKRSPKSKTKKIKPVKTSRVKHRKAKPVKTSKSKTKKIKPVSKRSEKIDPKLIKEIHKSNVKINEIKKEIRKVVVGQDKAINDLLACLISGGNALLEGVPGIAKTLIIKSLAQSVRCTSNF